jgi:Tol biopolymer transport system component
VSIGDEEEQVWLYDLSRETLTRLTFGGSRNGASAWTADGKRIAYQSNKEGPLNIFWQLADGSGGLERLTTSEHLNAPTSFSSDGEQLAYVELDPTTGTDIWILRLSDPLPGSGQVRKPRLFLRTPFNESVPRFSPDGHWLAYISDESGRYEVYVQPYPGPGGKWQISTEGGTEPAWNPNGRELFYRSGEKMMAVDITAQPGFTPGTPRILFQGPYVLSEGTVPWYDISPDGQRFLMVKLSDPAGAAPTQINVVLNWFEELKQKVPTGKN